MAHGQFGKWLESIGMNHRVANQMMKVATELKDGKWRTSSNLGMEALYQIATLPPEEREKEHVIPSTGEKGGWRRRPNSAYMGYSRHS